MRVANVVRRTHNPPHHFGMAVIKMDAEHEHPEGSLFDRIVDRRGSDSIKWSYYDSDVLPLWVADMDFPSPPAVVDALRERVNHGVFGYPTEPPELREIVVDRLKRLYDWPVSPDALVFLPNVAVAFNLACHAVAEPGDGVLIQTPVYFPILWIPKNVRLTANLNELQRTSSGTYEIDFEAFEAAITERTRVFVLCNPQNPVSRVFTETELGRLAEICLRHDVVICSDEIHADFVYDGRRHVPIASLGSEIERRTVTLLAPNKTFNIAGISCAIAVVPDEDLRQRLRGAQGGLVPHIGILSFTAALAAYRDGDAWLAELIEYLQRNRDLLADFVAAELPGVELTPVEGTYLAWLDCRGAVAENPHEFFLREARVAVNDGPVFGQGGEGFVRLNFGCPRSALQEALRRMRDALLRS